MTIVHQSFEEGLQRHLPHFGGGIRPDRSGPERQQIQAYLCADYATKVAAVALEESGVGGRAAWEFNRRAAAIRALPRVTDSATATAAIKTLGAAKTSLAKRLGFSVDGGMCEAYQKSPVARALFCAFEAVRLARYADPAHTAEAGDADPDASWRDRLAAAATFAARAGTISFVEISQGRTPDPRAVLHDLASP